MLKTNVGSSGYRGLQKIEFSRIGIESGANPNRQRPLRVNVADWKAIRDRNVQCTEVSRQHLIEPERAVSSPTIQLGKAAHRNPGKPAECPDAPELCQHTIHSVKILTHILDEQDSPIQVGEPRRADQRLQQSEISACERPFRHSAAKGDNPLLPRNENTFLLRQAPQPAGGLSPGENPEEVIPAELGHAGASHGAVKRHNAGNPGNGVQECSDVREPDHCLGLACEGREIDSIEEAGDSIASTDAPDCLGLGILKRLIEVEEPLIIDPGKVAMMLMGIFA
jgi:hypothetical protein